MAKTPFDHINAIYSNQSVRYYDELNDEDKKSFNVYLITMGISMVPDFLPVANEINKYWDQLDARSVYLFASQLIPKGRYFNKWIKGKKDDTYEPWLVDKIAQHYCISKSRSIDYLDVFYNTDEGKTALKVLLEGYGTEPKLIKKAKL